MGIKVKQWKYFDSDIFNYSVSKFVIALKLHYNKLKGKVAIRRKFRSQFESYFVMPKNIVNYSME